LISPHLIELFSRKISNQYVNTLIDYFNYLNYELFNAIFIMNSFVQYFTFGIFRDSRNFYYYYFTIALVGY